MTYTLNFAPNPNLQLGDAGYLPINDNSSVSIGTVSYVGYFACLVETAGIAAGEGVLTAGGIVPSIGTGRPWTLSRATSCCRCAPITPPAGKTATTAPPSRWITRATLMPPPPGVRLVLAAAPCPAAQQHQPQRSIIMIPNKLPSS